MGVLGTGEGRESPPSERTAHGRLETVTLTKVGQLGNFPPLTTLRLRAVKGLYGQ